MNMQFDRQSDRKAVLRTAKIVFENAVLDCIIVDLSPRGARVRFGSASALPMNMSVKLPDGTSYDAVRRWVRGEEAGLEFLSDTSLSPAARAAALEFHQRFIAEDYAPLIALERADFLHDEAVRVASVAVFLALVELQTVLKRRGVPLEGADPRSSPISTASTPASTGVLSGIGPLQSIAPGNTRTSATIQLRPVLP